MLKLPSAKRKVGVRRDSCTEHLLFCNVTLSVSFSEPWSPHLKSGDSPSTPPVVILNGEVPGHIGNCRGVLSVLTVPGGGYCY